MIKGQSPFPCWRIAAPGEAAYAALSLYGAG